MEEKSVLIVADKAGGRAAYAMRSPSLVGGPHFRGRQGPPRAQLAVEEGWQNVSGTARRRGDQ